MKILNQRAEEARDAKKRQENIKKTKRTANKLFPNEIWSNVNKIKFVYAELPDKTDGILVAKSRLPVNKSQENDLLKEIISAVVLTSMGASVYLIPRLKRPDGSGDMPGPDAIVNGELFEFKVITGTIKKLEERFRESRVQGKNVYMRIENAGITRQDVIRKLISVVNDKKYTGGYKGHVIFSMGNERNERTYFIKIRDLKRKKSGEPRDSP